MLGRTTDRTDGRERGDQDGRTNERPRDAKTSQDAYKLTEQSPVAHEVNLFICTSVVDAACKSKGERNRRAICVEHAQRCLFRDC